MKTRRRRLSASDAAILLGALLLLLSVGGIFFETTALNLRRPSGMEAGEGRVIRRVYQPRAAQVQALPTLAPFKSQPQTADNQPPVEQAPAGQELPITGEIPQGNQTPAAGEPPAPALPPDGVALEEQAVDNSFLAAGTPEPTAIPVPQALTPQRVVIPSIQLDAPVLPSGYQLIDINGQVYQQWEAPMEYAAGWQQTSAYLGMPGNTVLNGHHNIHGSVFGRLLDLTEGDVIEVYSGEWVIYYTVAIKLILPERYEDLSVRLENGRWMQPTADERLTLVTCWPPESNTHRLFIVAQPVDKRIAGTGPGP